MRITAPSPISAVLSATATSFAGASLPRCAASAGSPVVQRLRPASRSVSPSSRPAEIGQFGDESAVDKNEAARLDVAEHARRRFLATRLGRGIRRRAPAAWRRASARAGRYISTPRRGDAAGLPWRTRRRRHRAGRRRRRRRAADRAPCAKTCASSVSAAVLMVVTSAFTPRLPLDTRHSRAPRARARAPCRRS